jgi:hypothetical protein
MAQPSATARRSRIDCQKLFVLALVGPIGPLHLFIFSGTELAVGRVKG